MKGEKGTLNLIQVFIKCTYTNNVHIHITFIVYKPTFKKYF